MKAIKITLLIIVLGTVSFFIWQWNAEEKIDEKGGITGIKETNPFIEKIENDTETLKQLSKEDFDKDKFKNIQSELKAFYKDGELGKNSIQNNEQYKNLSKTLFSVYVPKFINQAYSVFEGDIWKQADLTYIQNEIKEIQNTEFYDVENSTYNSNFKEINSVMSTYHKLVGFNVAMKRFPSNLKYTADSRFPIDDVQEKIAESKIHLRTSENTKYINNLTWLQDEFKKIPHQLYLKHFDYLKKQIKQNTGKYKSSQFETQADYSRGIYQPLKASIDQFQHKMYGVDYNTEYRYDRDNLIDLLNKDNDNAREYFKKAFQDQIRNSN